MNFIQSVEFEPSGFYLYETPNGGSWKFSINFFYDAFRFRFPELWIERLGCKKGIIVFQDVTSTESVIKRFCDLQNEEENGGLLSEFSSCLGRGLIENLIAIHQNEWEKSESNHKAL
ncbi:hypothetical protein [Agrobacterium sp. Azo12]|uniref:hypothetical protein n=1 Tax=Agrobacterium sp. Azo12 TaxID=3031129 RepID=UPI0023D89ADD|nr:hypothetical protein [Agrobacterium sp. Azo12]MDO5897902.1 hypothetical protein [Agrobacterium sp. Azo12]